MFGTVTFTKNYMQRTQSFSQPAIQPSWDIFFPSWGCSSPWFTLQQLRPNTDQTCWVSFGRLAGFPLEDPALERAVPSLQCRTYCSTQGLCCACFKTSSENKTFQMDFWQMYVQILKGGTEKPWKATSRTWPIWFLYHIRSPLCSVWCLQS